MPELSIIIVNYNTRNLLLNCLDSIYADLAGISAEVWVVDNASSDGSIAAVESLYHQVNIIKNTTNMGFAYANNQALRLANGNVCLLLNSDTDVQKGALRCLVEVFENHPKAGAVGLRLLNTDLSIQPSIGKFASAWSEFLFQSFLFKIVPVNFPLGRHIHAAQFEAYSTEHPVEWVTGACLAVRIIILSNAGYLDESRFMYGEDMEWCWQIRHAGYEIWFSPVGSVIHLSQQSSRRDFSSWISRYTIGQLQFYRQHGSWIGLRLSCIFIVGGSVIRIIGWGLIGLLKPNRGNEVSQRLSGYRQAIVLGYLAFIGKYQ